MVLQVPHTLFRFNGCFDVADCFAGELAVDSPHKMLAAGTLRRYHSPHTLHSTRNMSYAARMNATCSTLRRDFDEHWTAAAAAPRLCNNSVEHGVFTLDALRASISYLPFCGAHCMPNLAVTATAARQEPHGWHLDWKESCWYEISMEHAICAAHFPAQLKLFPAGLACSEAVAD